MDKEKIKADALQFIQKQKTAVIASITEHGKPEASTVSFICDDEWNFYFITKLSSRKFANIGKNASVALVVGSNPKTPSTAQIEGEATVLNGGHYMINYLSKNVDIEDPKWWPLVRTPGVEFAVIKVKPTWLRWLNLDITGYPATYSEEPHQVI